MLPSAPSKLSIGTALSAEDIFALNQVPLVDITRKDHSNYAINDLILEMGHFLDEEIVNRIET
jgi:hypothetical protein